MYVLILEPRSSARAGSSLKFWVNCLAPHISSIDWTLGQKNKNQLDVRAISIHFPYPTAPYTQKYLGVPKCHPVIVNEGGIWQLLSATSRTWWLSLSSVSDKSGEARSSWSYKELQLNAANEVGGHLSRPVLVWGASCSSFLSPMEKTAA